MKSPQIEDDAKRKSRNTGWSKHCAGKYLHIVRGKGEKHRHITSSSTRLYTQAMEVKQRTDKNSKKQKKWHGMFQLKGTRTLETPTTERVGSSRASRRAIIL